MTSSVPRTPAHLCSGPGMMKVLVIGIMAMGAGSFIGVVTNIVIVMGTL